MSLNTLNIFKLVLLEPIRETRDTETIKKSNTFHCCLMYEDSPLNAKPLANTFRMTSKVNIIVTTKSQ